MASFNKVILMGNLAKDPELKQTQSGVSVCQFSLAVNRRYVKGEEQKCDFFNIVAWRGQAEFVAKNFTKGKAIIVCGEIQNREYLDKHNEKRCVTEIIASEVSFAGSQKEKTEKEDFEEISGQDDLPF